MNIKKLVVTLMCGTLILGGCSKGEGYTPQQDDPKGADIFDDLDLGEGHDVSPSKEELKYNSNQDYDVGRDYKVDVTMKKPEGTRRPQMPSDEDVPVTRSQTRPRRWRCRRWRRPQ